jgi:N-acetylmuramoyl-L-alanine amidase
MVVLFLNAVSHPAAAQTNAPALLQKAREAFLRAQELEANLNNKSPADRSRNESLTVVNAYQRVYTITPHTPYADNALVAIARLYEQIHDTGAAIRFLNFLIKEYPTSPFRSTAERDIARLQGAPQKKVGATSVDNVRYWETANSVRVVVDLGGEVTFKQGEAKSPDRVFIDISSARLNAVLIGKQWMINSALLSQIRVGQYDNSTVRLVLNVGAIGRVTCQSLRDPDRLIIDIVGRERPERPTSEVAAKLPAPPVERPSSTKVAASTAVETVSAEVKPPDPRLDSKPIADAKIATPAKPTDRGTRSLVRSLGLKLQRVVIDAGHGGHDTGSVGPGGYTERELVLDVAKRLKTLIESEMGAEVVMTREDDTFVPLEARTAIANRQEADLFISIHANSSRARTVRGVETFFLNFTTSREALDTASRENATSDRSIHDLQDLVKRIMLQDKVDESRELARHIQSAMVARKNSGTDRGVKQAPFLVLIGANMPSVLTEIGFITNPQEEKLVRTPQYRQQIAESLFGGVRSYSETLSGLKSAKTQEKNQD